MGSEFAFVYSIFVCAKSFPITQLFCFYKESGANVAGIC